MDTVIAFILIFGSLVFFHELGHFVFAKRAGILCREFAIGFGPKILSFRKGETLYTIRLLPIGGYVRMAGEDPEVVEIKAGYRVGLQLNEKEEVIKIILNKKDQYENIRLMEVENVDLEHDLFIAGYVEDGEEDVRVRYPIHPSATIVEDDQETIIAPYNRQFASKSLGQRAMTIFAGPLMNFILAFLIFIIIGFLQGVPIEDPVLGEITNDGAAKEAGLREGDVVQSINGAEVTNWTDIIEIVRDHPGEEVTFSIVRDGELIELPVVPHVFEENNQEYGQIGVYRPFEKNPLAVAEYGVTETYFWTKQIIYILGKMVTGNFSIEMLSGPVGIYKSTEEVANAGIYNLMKWTALLSINLGIMNLLPIPALDGGRLLFFAVELVRGKPIDRQKEGIVHFIGFALLMLLMLVVTWNDIQRFFL
ncbi:MAG TPA: RIP metalloprotease RseP [Bacillus sp. (in: firmicutes)]|uniref:RIP metalloprotease RseP n=1 Tax=Bacillus litorisediminis TaxID=2922713 RepID=UPI001FAC3054|nr:RIP metalloprotease RseP [Bacillus litorisediminis]HWO77991.1 RIP metalloprotease RseP [Bacillus sp. (in: firmicutes)]